MSSLVELEKQKQDLDRQIWQATRKEQQELEKTVKPYDELLKRIERDQRICEHAIESLKQTKELVQLDKSAIQDKYHAANATSPHTCALCGNPTMNNEKIGYIDIDTPGRWPTYHPDRWEAKCFVCKKQNRVSYGNASVFSKDEILLDFLGWTAKDPSDPHRKNGYVLKDK